MTKREFKLQQEAATCAAMVVAGRLAAAVLLAGCIIALLLLPTGCGGSGGSGESTPRWNIEVGAADVTAQARAWELCGGIVYCTYYRHSLFNTQAGFHGEATTAAVQCYEQYGMYETATLTTDVPYQCEAY